MVEERPMQEQFKIYVEQLREGQEKKLSETFAPDFLEINEEDLSFQSPVSLEGKAYLADQELILNWNIRTVAHIPCSICNEPVAIDIIIHNFYHSEPVATIKTGIYNFKELLRETILLEVPPFAECNQGHCPSRKEVARYLKEPFEKKKNEEKEGYQPFADLDWKS